jgi:probable F420-dependent oxidoreductase
VEIGLILPTNGPGASRDGLDAATEIAVELGWTSVWVTDHLMVPQGPEAAEYGTILEAIVSLTYIAARYDHLRIGTSVIIPPMRNSVILAKQLATIDELSGGRLTVGVGVADTQDLQEFQNLGQEDRFRGRGALVDETIALWRHLWSGIGPPFVGEYHLLEDYVFSPLPPQGGNIPIWVGGRSQRALRRTAELADGYHAARTGPGDLEARLPLLQDLLEPLGRPMPTLSVRTRVKPGEDPSRTPYALRGSPLQMQADVRRFAELGVQDLVVVLDETDPERLVGAARWFNEEVALPALG